eukprot:jgi/Galph1/271/GphlegSOOS_G5065.1
MACGQATCFVCSVTSRFQRPLKVSDKKIFVNKYQLLRLRKTCRNGCYQAQLERQAETERSNSPAHSNNNSGEQQNWSSNLLQKRLKEQKSGLKGSRQATQLEETCEELLNKLTTRHSTDDSVESIKFVEESILPAVRSTLKEAQEVIEALKKLSSEGNEAESVHTSKLGVYEKRLKEELRKQSWEIDSKTQWGVSNSSATVELSGASERRRIPRLSVSAAPIRKAANRFLRTDGSVDFRAVRTSVEWLLDRMLETWERLNGRSSEPKLTDQLVLRDKRFMFESDTIRETKRRIEEIERELKEASKARELILRKEDPLGKLMKLKEIRNLDEKVDNLRKSLAIKVLQVELERVYMFLCQEVELSDDFAEQKILVAAYEGADSQLERLSVLADSNVALVVSDDELGTLASGVEDIRSRLGLETDAYISGWDWNRLQTYFGDIWKKSKEGLEFYTRGTKLLGGDIMYATKRAVSGYTLSPREVRTLRRTGRDLLTLLPFTLILILPLTPVGHVLVFSFIQRYFPDLFPSTFGESRQERMKRYEAMQLKVSETGRNNQSANLQTSEYEKAHDAKVKDGDSTFLSDPMTILSIPNKSTDQHNHIQTEDKDSLESLPSLDEVHLAE